MFKLLAFFALLACAFCAPSPVPAPAPSPTPSPAPAPGPKPGVPLIPYDYSNGYGLTYARTYNYGNLGYAYVQSPYYTPTSYYYNAPLTYII